jgi:hypothetical protein
VQRAQRAGLGKQVLQDGLELQERLGGQEQQVPQELQDGPVVQAQQELLDRQALLDGQVQREQLDLLRLQAQQVVLVPQVLQVL